MTKYPVLVCTDGGEMSLYTKFTETQLKDVTEANIFDCCEPYTAFDERTDTSEDAPFSLVVPQVEAEVKFCRLIDFKEENLENELTPDGWVHIAALTGYDIVEFAELDLN
jgi:hypothetical protein